MRTKLQMIVMALFAMMGVVAHAQTPKELTEQGYKHLDNGEYVKGVECFKKAAQQGDALGQDEYGCALLFGYGVEQDYKSAYVWIQKSANQGFAEGQRDMGYIYHYGLGVEQDFQKALEWYNKAAKQGNAHAEKGLGDMYYYGEGVQQSYEQAVTWYRKAADHNDEEAQNVLGNCYYSGKGVQQSHEEAVKWFRKSAEQGFSWGECNLGNMYANGTGIPQDYGQAMQWYKKASDHGLGNASQNIAMLYWIGNGVEKDQKKAVEWFTKGAEQGYAISQRDLGYCYENGSGVEKDIDEAIRWYMKAAEQGDENAKNSLESIKIRIDKVEVNGKVIDKINGKYDLGEIGEDDECVLHISNISSKPLAFDVRGDYLKDSHYSKLPINPNDHTQISLSLRPSSLSSTTIKIKTFHQNWDEARSVKLSYYRLCFVEGLAIVKREGKYGVIDNNNQIVIPFVYDKLEYFHDDIKAMKNGKWGLINKSNKVLVPFEYEDVILEYRNGLVGVENNGNFYVVNDKNKTIYNLPKNYYGTAIIDGDGNVVFQKEGNFGYIDKNYNVVIPAQYDEVRACGGLHPRLYNGAIVKKNGKFGVIDKTNSIIIPFEYEKLLEEDNGLFLAQKNGKWGKIDKNNKVVVSFIYDNWLDMK